MKRISGYTLRGPKGSEDQVPNCHKSKEPKLDSRQGGLNVHVGAQCDPCIYHGDIIKASTFCPTCNGYLCYACGKSHSGSIATRHHIGDRADKPVVVKEEFNLTTNEDNAEETVSKEPRLDNRKSGSVVQRGVQCDPCIWHGDTIKAVTYCRTCNEHLCYACEKFHSGLKVTRNHVLGSEVEKPVEVKRETAREDNTEETARYDRKSKPNDSITNYLNSESIATRQHVLWPKAYRPVVVKQEKTMLTSHKDNAGETVRHDVNNGETVKWIDIPNDKRDSSSAGDLEPTLPKCKEHPSEIVKYFCEDHKGLGCDQCHHASNQKCCKTLLSSTTRNKTEIVSTENATLPEPNTAYSALQNMSESWRHALSGVSLLGRGVTKHHAIKVMYDSIYSIAFLSRGELIMCSYKNIMLAVYETNNNFELIMKTCKPLESKPWAVCTVNNNLVAVTFPSLKKIQFFSVQRKLEMENSFTVDRPCWGIECQGNLLYIACHENTGRGEILKMTINGKMIRRFGLDRKGISLFMCPYYIRVGRTSGRMYVSDFRTHTVTCLSSRAMVIYHYKHKDLLCPTDIYVDSQENVLVCGNKSHNIHQLDKLGNHHSIAIRERDGVVRPWSLSIQDNGLICVVGMCNQPACRTYYLCG